MCLILVYRFLNIAGIFIGASLLSVYISENNSVDAPSDIDLALTYGLGSLVGGMVFYYIFYTARKEKQKEEIKLQQEREAREKRTKAEEEKKKKRKAEQKKKQEIERKKRLEEEKREEKIRLENNSYYYEIEENNKKVVKGPFAKEEINNLLNKNEISLLTKVKFGLHTKSLKQLKSFPEFTSGFEDFL